MELEEYLTKRGQLMYVAFTTKNPRCKEQHERALRKLEKKWKAYCFQNKLPYNKNGKY